MITLQKLLSWIKFPAVFLAPFVVAVGSWQLALLVPGQVETWHWKALVFWSFICAGLFTIFMLFRTRLGLVLKIVLAMVCTLVFLFFALLGSARSHCGDEQRYIGQNVQSRQVESCR